MTSLTWDQVTAFRLKRIHLARRTSPAKAEEVVSSLCGAHAQIMSTVALALGARVNKLTEADIQQALNEQRSLVKTWNMRGTLHVFAARDLPLYCAAGSTRDQYNNPAFLKYFGLEQADIDTVLDAIPQALDGKTLTREELANEILRITKRPHLEERLRSGWGELLKPAAFRGLLCFGPQQGRNITFVRPDQWLGTWEELETDVALEEVFRRFLSAYAPASRAEVARWWGVRPPEVGRVLKRMTDELAEVEVGNEKRWVLAKDLRALKSAQLPEGVRLLPSFDQLLVMSAPHSVAIVDEAFADKIYRQRIAVWSLPAVLIDGRVQAAWKLERKKNTATARLTPFKKLTRKHITALEDEVTRLGEVVGLDTRLVLDA